MYYFIALRDADFLLTLIIFKVGYVYRLEIQLTFTCKQTTLRIAYCVKTIPGQSYYISTALVLN